MCRVKSKKLCSCMDVLKLCTTERYFIGDSWWTFNSIIRLQLWLKLITLLNYCLPIVTISSTTTTWTAIKMFYSCTQSFIYYATFVKHNINYITKTHFIEDHTHYNIFIFAMSLKVMNHLDLVNQCCLN